MYPTPGGATLQHGTPNSRFHVLSKCADSPGDTPLLNPDSDFPSFRGPSVGTPKSRFHVSKCADSRILLCKFQIPSFRVSEAPSWVRSGGTQIPDSEFPSFRGPLLGPSPRDPQIPDSEFPSFRGPLFGPRQMESQIPDSEFPSFRGPLLGRRTQQEGPTNSLIKFPSVIPSAHQRWEHRFRNTERSFYFRSCTFV